MEECGGHLGVSEHQRPFAEGEVGGDDGRGISQVPGLRRRARASAFPRAQPREAVQGADDSSRTGLEAARGR